MGIQSTEPLRITRLAGWLSGPSGENTTTGLHNRAVRRERWRLKWAQFSGLRGTSVSAETRFPRNLRKLPRKAPTTGHDAPPGMTEHTRTLEEISGFDIMIRKIMTRNLTKPHTAPMKPSSCFLGTCPSPRGSGAPGPGSSRKTEQAAGCVLGTSAQKRDGQRVTEDAGTEIWTT